MLRTAFRTGLLVGLVYLVSSPLMAQSFGRTGGAGGAARGGTGGAFGGGASAFGGGMGGSGGFGGSGFGGGGFGGQRGGMGGGAFGGGGGALGGGAGGQAGFLTDGQNQFMLGNQATGGFVGREAADGQQFYGGTQGGGAAGQQLRNQARRQQFQMQNQARNNGGRRGGRGGAQGPNLRVNLRVGFQPSQPATAGLSGRLQDRVSRTLTSRLGVTDPTIELVGQTVILRGTVATEEERLLAEQILSLEPGVTSVTNQLQVAPTLPPPRAE